MDAVSKAILDVAFATEPPPIAVNLVHPRPVEWNAVILSVRDAILQTQEIDPDALRIVSFEEWFTMLEGRSKTAKDADLITIVSEPSISNDAFSLMCLIACDQAPRVLPNDRKCQPGQLSH
jgi:hypothetical protein